MISSLLPLDSGSILFWPLGEKLAACADSAFGPASFSCRLCCDNADLGNEPFVWEWLASELLCSRPCSNTASVKELADCSRRDSRRDSSRARQERLTWIMTISDCNKGSYSINWIDLSLGDLWEQGLTVLLASERNASSVRYGPSRSSFNCTLAEANNLPASRRVKELPHNWDKWIMLVSQKQCLI